MKIIIIFFEKLFFVNFFCQIINFFQLQGENEKSEILDKSDSNSKDADAKNSVKEDEKEKAKIHTAIVDESDPLKDDVDDDKDDDGKDPLSNSEDENNDASVEDPGSGDEKFDTSEEKNSLESDEENNSKVI